MPPRCHRSSLPMLAILASSIALHAAAAAPPTVSQPAEAPAREHWTLREVWRQGGDDDGLLLGRVGVVMSMPGGEVYALDSQLAQVLVLDRQGRHVRTLGREGEGPGEFRQPTGLVWTADGLLGVQQTFPGRLVYLDPQSGEPRGQWSAATGEAQAGGFQLLLGARERGGVRLVAGSSASFDASSGTMRDTRYLALLDASGQERRRLAEASSSQSFERQVRDDLADHFPGDRGLWDLGPDGRTYLVPRYDAYRIDVYSPSGDLERTIVRDQEARRRTDAEKEEQRRSVNMNVNGREVSIDWKQQDRARSISRLQILDDGTLWVTSSHGDARWAVDAAWTWDVYDADGTLLREVTVTIPEGGKGHRLVLLDDGRFVLIKGLESLSLMIGASSEGSTTAMGVGGAGEELHELVCFERVIPRRM